MTQNDIKTVSLKGKPYVMVAERVRMIYEQKRDFEVLDSTFQELAGRVICKVVVLVDGKRFTGSAEAKILNAMPKSADETNPFECAETSALGRALAFAGLGTVDGIASFDEVARGMSRDDLRAGMVSVTPLKQRLNSTFDKALVLGLIEKGKTPEESGKAFLKWAGGVLGDIQLTNSNQLNAARLDTIEAYLNSQDAA